MTEEPLDELERRRAELHARLAGTGDFRPGSVSQTWRQAGGEVRRGSFGPFTGSGVAEAGCKAVVGQRLKMPGMRRTVPAADAIIALRCGEASSHWEEIWQRPRNQTATA